MARVVIRRSNAQVVSGICGLQELALKYEPALFSKCPPCMSLLMPGVVGENIPL